MHLALSGARADCAPGDQIGDILRRDHIEKFRPRGHPQFVQFQKQLARDAQAVIDAEAAVELGIVDQTLPADRRARFFEIDAHHDQQIGRKTVALL